MKYHIAAAALAGALVTAGAANAADVETMMAAQGQNTFQHRCGGCHSADPSKNTFGPSLHGVVGRPAASLARFAYSGTRMRHVSITDGAEQDYLLAFLRGLK